MVATHLIEQVINITKRFSTRDRSDADEESKLKEHFGIDSIKVIDLVIAFEEEFDIEIGMALLTYENFGKIKSIASLVESLINQKK